MPRPGFSLCRGTVGRILPWLIAFMVYLGALAVAGFLFVQQVTSEWQSSLGGVLTVQLPPADDDIAARREVDAALDVLRATPGIARAEPVSEKEMLSLLSPWLGETALAHELPLPRLIDVQLAPGANVAVSTLQRRLQQSAPAALVDDHGESLAALRSLTTTLKAVSIGVIVSIALVTMGTVFVVTRAGIGIHGDTIEILHLIGADDAYVARQFTWPVVRQALLGGIIGWGAAVACLLALQRVVAELSGATLSPVAFTPAHWTGVSAVPLVMALLALITTQVAVRRSLAARV
jgi:cell division transport system permease protein